jgi:GNAT superfamily N-acetyltransferase
MAEDAAHVAVRSARATDAAAVSSIYVASSNIAFGGLLPQMVSSAARIERWRRDLCASPPQRWWVAERAGQVLGFAGIAPSRDPVDPTVGELDTIAVDPALWRLGIGRRLMAVAVRHLESDGYERAVVWTLTGNGPARRFYVATGWREDGVTRHSGRQTRYGRAVCR